MKYVLTLVGKPLDEALANETARAVGAGMAPDWLMPGEACDIATDLAPDDVRAALAAVLADAPVDHCLQAAAGRRKRLLIADMDSTMITVECVDALAEAAGVGDAVREITEIAMRGELDFEGALRQRVAMLEGLPEDTLETVFETAIAFSPGARTLVQTMRAGGAHAALVSGGFTFFTGRVAAALGFHEHRANRLEIAAGALTGRVGEPVLGRDAKVAALDELCRAGGFDAASALCIGDGANDIGMIEAAGLGVAWRGKPVVRAAADACIDHADLSAALFFQGYRAGDLVTG